ncbi:MAG TPA: (4Fe-4S)-binding protein [Candidatus Aminicenantes bacterium]|nr:(4Fe-4S)-binding protein [Candidatus Aminicenantes bacterium]
MKQIVVISGKGGTGKTVMSACFASLARNAVLADVDVDASNLHLLLRPEIQERHVFQSGRKARIDAEKCTGCGLCLPPCRFDALFEDREGKVAVEPLSCEGCGLCFHICPEQAVEMETPIAGEWYVSKTKYGPFVHARLGIAEENSGKLVTEVRKKAREIAESEKRDLVIMDGAPGIGCPVIASLTGTHLALVVTEPTPSGRHDMERIVGLARHFKIRVACCINKFDLNLENSEQIQRWCGEQTIPVVGKITFDPAVMESVVRGVPYVEYTSNSSAEDIRRMWSSLLVLIT